MRAKNESASRETSLRDARSVLVSRGSTRGARLFTNEVGLSLRALPGFGALHVIVLDMASRHSVKGAAELASPASQAARLRQNSPALGFHQSSLASLAAFPHDLSSPSNCSCVIRVVLLVAVASLSSSASRAAHARGRAGWPKSLRRAWSRLAWACGWWARRRGWFF